MNSDPRDYKIDISSINADEPKAEAPNARPFLSVRFDCCRVYQRVYRNRDGTRYEGRCPKCMRAVTFVVGDGGSNERFFVVE